MKVGIDSYSFHRLFGEVYPGLQEDPGRSWRMETDFLDFARRQQVGEVALETLFFDALDDGYCTDLKGRLDDLGLERVIGWGHPDGLHGGSDESALADLKLHIPVARKVGAQTVRIVASSMLYVDQPKEPQIRNTVRMLSEAVEVAETEDVVLALENHIDFSSSEILQILDGVASQHLKANFDTGNALRLYEDPVAAAHALAPHTISTHTKDIAPLPRGGAPSERFTWWPSCPVGAGQIDMPAVIAALRDGGFDGALGVELDLLGPQWADRREEELVADSVGYLKRLLADESARAAS